MREIKFRAWNIHCKIMEPVHDLYWFEENGIRTIPDNDYYIIMQYTGLKDQLGKEIYEGDIVQVMTLYSEGNTASVSWGDVHPMYRHMAGPTWLLHFDNGTEGPLYPYCDYRSYYTVKIIGNIYEQPGLLENK